MTAPGVTRGAPALVRSPAPDSSAADSPAGGAGWQVSVLDGAPSVLAHLDSLDALAAACDLPATARGPWTRSRVAAVTDQHVMGVLVHRDGRLRAATVLLTCDEPGQPPSWELASGGDGYRAGVAALDAAAAHELGRAITAATAERAPWRSLDLGPMPQAPVVGWLAEALGAWTEDVAPIPYVNCPSGRVDTRDALTGLLSHGLMRTLRKARNRLAADGLAWDVVVGDDLSMLDAALPAMERARRERDRDHGVHTGREPSHEASHRLRPESRPDAPTPEQVKSIRLRALLGSGTGELSLLTIGGTVAAHVVGVVDGRSYGVVEGFHDPAWGRYAPGRLLEAAVLERVLTDPRLDRLDWMTSVAPETLIATTGAQACVRLTTRDDGRDDRRRDDVTRSRP